MGRRELREHIFRLLFRRDFFPEEEMKEQEAFYIEYLADPEQKEVDYIVQKTEKIMAMNIPSDGRQSVWARWI